MNNYIVGLAVAVVHSKFHQNNYTASQYFLSILCDGYIQCIHTTKLNSKTPSL